MPVYAGNPDILGISGLPSLNALSNTSVFYIVSTSTYAPWNVTSFYHQLNVIIATKRQVKMKKNENKARFTGLKLIP